MVTPTVSFSVMRTFNRGPVIMAWLHQGSPVLVTERGKEGEHEAPQLALISVRPFVNPLEQEPRYRYGARVAFENGVFGTTPIGPEREENPGRAETRAQKWMRITMNEHGDLPVPDFGTVPAADLYRGYPEEESGASRPHQGPKP